MIVNKKIIDGNPHVLYESSTILSSVFEESKNELTIIFHNGSQYRYKGVTVSEYHRFELAESQGKVLNSHIKQHSFDKLGSVSPEAIKEEINNYKSQEEIEIRIERESKLLAEMSYIIQKKETYDIISKDDLLRVQLLITKLIGDEQV
jgi:hypothetical protein